MILFFRVHFCLFVLLFVFHVKLSLKYMKILGQSFRFKNEVLKPEWSCVLASLVNQWEAGHFSGVHTNVCICGSFELVFSEKFSCLLARYIWDCALELREKGVFLGWGGSILGWLNQRGPNVSENEAYCWKQWDWVKFCLGTVTLPPRKLPAQSRHRKDHLRYVCCPV